MLSRIKFLNTTFELSDYTKITQLLHYVHKLKPETITRHLNKKYMLSLDTTNNKWYSL